MRASTSALETETSVSSPRPASDATFTTVTESPAAFDTAEFSTDGSAPARPLSLTSITTSLLVSQKLVHGEIVFPVGPVYQKLVHGESSCKLTLVWSPVYQFLVHGESCGLLITSFSASSPSEFSTAAASADFELSTGTKRRSSGISALTT